MKKPNAYASIVLVDGETFFVICDSDIDNITYIPYGVFSATIANISSDRMLNMFNRLHEYFRKMYNNPDYIPTFKERFYQTIKRYIDFTFCLNKKQSYLVAKCLLEEMMVRFIDELEAGHGVITDIERCIPFILYNPKIRNNIKNILERKSDDLTLIMQETKTDSIDSQFLLDEEKTIYYIYSSSDYLLIDLSKYLKHSNIVFKECECCHRLFIPTRKSDKYCNIFSMNTFPKKCKDIMHISPNDEFVKTRNKARDKQHKQIKYYKNKGEYEHNFLYNLYYNWSDECAEKFKEFKAKGDINGFKNWIEETMFSKERLSSLYENETDKNGENE